MLLHELLDSVDVLELRGDPRTEIASVTHDSRAVGAGDLFCCVPGSTTDGHDHAPAAVAAGAAALLVERPLGLAVAEAQVASVRAAMGPVAAAACGHPSTRLAVLGVTGTNGKTTTTYLLEAIARAAGIRPGVIGTIGARIDGVPLPGERTTPEATELQALLARMVDSRRRPGRHRGVVPRPGHAPGRRHPLRRRLLHQPLPRPSRLPRRPGGVLRGQGPPVRPGPDRRRRRQPRRPPRRRDRPPGGGRRLVGPRLRAREPGGGGPGRGPRRRPRPATGSELVTPYGSAAVRSPLVGRFNASNALAAAATALAAGLDVDSVAAGLSAPLVVPGRMERVEAGQPFAVLVDYAHTPDGLEQVLRAARPLVGAPDGRLIVVFGCGGDRDRAKRPAMGKAAAALADVIVVTSDNPRSEDPMAIIDEVRGRDPVRRPPARRARPPAGHPPGADRPRPRGRGRRGRQGPRAGQTAGGVTVPFDDRVVTREELAGTRLGPPAAVAGRHEADAGRDRRHHRRADPGAATRRRPSPPIPSTPARWRRELCSSPCGRSATGTTSSRTRSTGEPPGRWSRAGGSGFWGPGEAAEPRAGRRHRRWPSPPWAGPPASGSIGLPVVGITGSTGKTSTKDLTAAALAPAGPVGASPVSFNNEIGVPLTLLSAPEGAVAVVAEMGARGVGHIATLCAVARPTIGVITNIGMAHAEFFGEPGGGGPGQGRAARSPPGRRPRHPLRR